MSQHRLERLRLPGGSEHIDTEQLQPSSSSQDSYYYRNSFLWGIRHIDSVHPPFPHWFSQCARMRQIKELPECDQKHLFRSRAGWNHWSHPWQSSNSCWFWPGSLIEHLFLLTTIPSIDFVTLPFEERPWKRPEPDWPRWDGQYLFWKKDSIKTYRVFQNLLIDSFHRALCMIGDRIFRIWGRSSRWGGAWQFELSFQLGSPTLIERFRR